MALTWENYKKNRGRIPGGGNITDQMPGPIGDIPSYTSGPYPDFKERQVSLPTNPSDFSQQRANRAASDIGVKQSSATGQAVAQGAYGSTAAALAAASQGASEAGRQGELMRDDIIAQDLDQQYRASLDNANLGYTADNLNLQNRGLGLERDRLRQSWNEALMGNQGNELQAKMYQDQKSRMAAAMREIESMMISTGSGNDYGRNANIRLKALIDMLAGSAGLPGPETMWDGGGYT